jgi:arylsulfatase A-like enzyme
MPACTTSRAVFFTARFPFRTNVLGALGPDDLANSMVSPYEMTTPKLLARRGYEGALFGKFHLALQANNPAGLAMPHNLG